MSDSTLDQLAASAADMFVRALASDAWVEVKHQYSKITHGRDQAVSRSREAVSPEAGGGSEALARETTAWEARLRDALDADPSLAAELRRLCSQPPVSQNTQNLVQRGIQGSAQQAVATGAGSSAVNAQGKHVKVNSPDQRRFTIATPFIPLINAIKNFGTGKTLGVLGVVVIAGGGVTAAVYHSGNKPTHQSSGTGLVSKQIAIDLASGAEVSATVTVAPAYPNVRTADTVGCGFSTASQDFTVYPVTIVVTDLSSQPAQAIQVGIQDFPSDPNPENLEADMVDQGNGQVGCTPNTTSDGFTVAAHASVRLRAYLAYLSQPTLPSDFGLQLTLATTDGGAGVGTAEVMVNGQAPS